MRFLTVLFLVLIAAIPVVSAEADPASMRLSGDALWVEIESGSPGEAEPQRVLVRRSTAAMEPGEAGADPSGRALFVTWTEAGSERWAAYSRDGGQSWSEARPEPNELRFHRGSVPPGGTDPSVPAALRAKPGNRLHVLQFKTIGLPQWREALTALGVELLRFFPDNGHVVRFEPDLLARVEALPFVERVVPFHPGYRVGPDLQTWLAEPVADADERLRVNAMSFGWGSAPKSRLAADAEAMGAEVALWFPSGRRLELWVTRAELRALAAHDEVAWVDRWTAPETDMDLVREDSGANFVEALDGSCGQGVRGEVMDAGIQADHMDFDGILLHGPTGNDSHGTSTFGVVFGNGDRDGDGDAMATGHLPCAEQGIFASYYGLADRFAHTQELKAAPYFASFQSNSWGGGTTTNYNSTSSEIDDIIFQLDIAIVQSQSNTGNQFSRPQAWAKNIISVGGIQHGNNLDPSDDGWNGVASIGPARDGRIKPDVAYWNEWIYTTTSSATPGGGYTTFFSGTSSATPEVAGVLGLMVQMWSENVWGTNPTGATVFERQPHFGTIKALLINNSRQWAFSGDGADLTRVHQGWGRPSARLARERAATSFIVDQDQPLTLGQTAGFPVAVPSGESELKVTMVYPDPPGTLATTLHRINDVDLRVTSPSGTLYHGNVGLDRGVASLPGGSPNGIDTVENVFVPYPEPGMWTVEVEAVEINADGHPGTPGDDVVFALVVTGAAQGGSCGNGVRESGEDCDGTDLGPATCGALGCDTGGAPGCNLDCAYDNTPCSGCPSCGDGVCDPGETCLTCGTDCISQSALACGNGLCETAQGEDCLSCSIDCRNELSGTPSGRYCCGDGTAQYGVGCDDDRCSDNFTTCVEIPSLAYCCGDAFCTAGSEDELSCNLDCASGTPGEAGAPASGMMLADYDRTTGAITLNFGAGCAATDHTLEFGELTPANLASYAWSGQECGLGAAGPAVWTPPGSPGALFFVIVANDGAVEGSYGVDGAGTERPEDGGGAGCPLPQALTARCD